MPSISRILKGSLFFTGFLPSFTRIGYAARRAHWPPLEPDFEGQTWLVTGASTGIGREIALGAAAAGARVEAVARSADRLARLAAELDERRSKGSGGRRGEVRPRAADLSLVADTRRLTAELARAGTPVDVLVNNVGVLLNRPATTAEGLDAAFAVNLLNQFVLTEGLRDAGLLGRDSCVVTMTSGGLYNVPLSIAGLQSHAHYNGSLAYAGHKRAQAALTAWWRRHDLEGIRYYVMHPGWVDTPGVQTALPEFRRLVGPLLRTPAEGADTALWLAAERPGQDDDEGIWFDRSLRPAHKLWGTRSGDDPAELVAYLERTAAAVAAAEPAGRPSRA